MDQEVQLDQLIIQVKMDQIQYSQLLHLLEVEVVVKLVEALDLMVVLVVVTLLQIQVVEGQEIHHLSVHLKEILEPFIQVILLNQVKVVEVLVVRLLMVQKLEEMEVLIQSQDHQ